MSTFKTLFKDKVILVSFWGDVVLFVVAILTAGIAYPHYPPFLPLYNKLAWGYARLGARWEIVVPIGTALLLCTANAFLAKYLFTKNPLLTRFLFLISLLLALFTCIFIMKLTLIVL